MAAVQLPSNLVEALNNAKLATKASKKVELLGQLHELLIRGEPAHLDTVLSDVIEFQVDRAESVRKAVVNLVTAAVQVRCTPRIISQATTCLSGMLGDDATAVVKQAAIAAHGVLCAGMSLHMSAPQGDPDNDSAWTAAQHLQAAVSTLATSSADTGVRMVGIKMGEQAAMLYTAPEALALPDAATLVTTADSLVKLLGELLKGPNVQQLPGPVVICCIKALGAVVMQRGNMVHRGMPALLALATKGVFRVPTPGDDLSPVAASCGTALKDILNRVMRSNAEATKTWQKRLELALRTMGADASADSALRHIERQAAKLRASEKRKAPEQGGLDPKVLRISTPTGADCSVNNTPARTPTPAPVQQQQHGVGSGLLSQLLTGNLGSGDLVTDTQRVFEALVKGEQMAAVETILAQIEPSILAELVVRWMVNLPPQPAAPSTQQPLPPPAAAAATGAVAAAAAGSMTPAAVQAPLASAQHQQQETQHSANHIKPEPDVGKPPPPPPPPQQQKQKVDPRKRARPLPATAAVAVPALKLPAPLPQALNQQQLQHMRKSAVQRILQATKNKPIRNFRELLLSRLVSQASHSDGLSELVLQHLLSDYHGQRGHILVVRWLYALAAALAAAGEGVHTAAAEGEGLQRLQGVVAQHQAAAVAAAAAAAVVPEAMRDVATNGDQQQQVDEQQEQQASEDAEIQEAAAFDSHDSNHSQVDSHHQQRQQQEDASRSTGGDNSSKGQTCHAGVSDMSATTYDTVLTAVLQGLRQHLPSEDLAIPRILQEAPVLPLRSIVQFLRSLIVDGDGWAAMAINAAEGLVETRPPMRADLVQLVLDAAVAVDLATREQAVGLLVSKLLAWQEFEGHIIQYAREQLLLLLDPRKLMQQQQKNEVQQQQVVEEQQDGSAAAEAEASGVAALPQQQQAAAEGVPLSDGEEGRDSVVVKEEQQGQQQQQQAATPVHQHEQRAKEQQQDRQDQQQQEVTVDIAVAAQHCMLFMSLCAGKPELMATLLETYGKAGPEARAGMERYAASLARAVGAHHPTLLDLIKSPPEGSKDLLLLMITALVDNIKPPQELVAACVTYSTTSQDVVLLAPVTPAMPKSDVTRLLPQFMTQLSRVQLRMLYRKLTSAAGEQPAHFKPTELLVALHQVKSTAALRVTTKQQTAALDVALHAPEVFPVAVVVQTIRRLESLSPLPQLFMRSVITALQISPKLTDTVMELLRRLIQKQIWLNERQWQGFIICCEKAAPASYPVLLQLPSNILEQAMEKLNERHWKPLLHYALSKECVVPVYGPTKEVLNLFLDRLTKRQREKAAAAGISTTDGAVSGAAAAATTGSSSATKPKAPAGVRGKQPPLAAAAAAGEKATDKFGRERLTVSNRAHLGITGNTVAVAANGGQEQQQQGGEGPETDQAAVAKAIEQQQQNSDDDGGKDDDFMLDFEDDE